MSVRAAVALVVAAEVAGCAHAPPPIARESGEGYVARLEAPATIPVATPAALSLTIEARPGFHTTEDYPHHARLRGDGVEAPSRVALARTPSSLTAAIPVTARAPGRHAVAADVAFAVCDADRCLIEKRTLAITVEAR